MAQATSPDPADLRARLRGRGRLAARPLPRRFFAVHYRAPVEDLATLVPPGAEVDPVGRSGCGLLSVLVSGDRRALRLLGPAGCVVHRIVVRPRNGPRASRAEPRAAWVLRAESPRPLGRGAVRFEHDEDGEVWATRCTARDPLGSARFEARLSAIDKQAPAGSVFASARELWEFAFALEGTCAHDASRDRLVFRPQDTPERDLSFCHDFDGEFPLVRMLTDELGLGFELDSACQLHDVRPVRGGAPARGSAVGRVARLPSGA